MVFLISFIRAFFLGGVVAFGLISCGGSGSSAPTAEESATQALDSDSETVSNSWDSQSDLYDRYADFTDDVVLDDEKRVTGDSKRSKFEGKQMTHIGGDLGNKQFAASRYTKKNWLGKKEFDRSKYGSAESRWDGEEYYVQKQAQESGLAERNGKKAYTTNNYQTGSAREHDGYRIPNSGNLQSQVQQGRFQQPLKIRKEDYEKMSLSESKRLLGRE